MCKKLTKYYEKRKCKCCNRTFYVPAPTMGYHQRKFTIRPRTAKTCSMLCAKQYQRKNQE